MQQCSIYNDRALNFFRATCGFLALIGFLIQNEWLVLATAILFILGVFSMKLNFLYQFYDLFSNRLLKQEIKSVQKDSGELKFVYSFTGIAFFASFLLLYFGKFVDFAWGLDLVVSFLTLLASFTNICVAALMYVISRRIFNILK